MIPDIFDIVGDKVVINVNCLLIPQLKAVHEAYKDPLPAFSFLHFMFAPKGPYCNTPEEDIEEVLLLDFPGEYTLEDSIMIEAIKKMETFLDTATYRYYKDNKFLLEKLGKFARETPITAGRDGNITALSSQIRSVGKTITEFKILESTVLKEIAEAKGRTRGGKTLAYDQSK